MPEAVSVEFQSNESMPGGSAPDVEPTIANQHSPLLECLVFLTKYYGKPFSAESLSAGLPLPNGRLTPALFPRAAARGGLSAKLVEQPLDKVNDLLLPCVVTLKNGRACVLLELDRQQGLATIAWPETPEGYQEIAFEQLIELSSGYLFYLRKRYRFDARSPSSLKTRYNHWFWGPLRESLPIYRDVLIAAFFINLFAIASPLFVMNVYDRVVPNLALHTLWVLAIGMSVVLLFDFVMKQLRAHLIEIAAKKSDILLSSKLFEKLLSVRMDARPASIGAFARNIQEFDSVRDFITSATMAALIDIPFSLLFLTVIWLVAGPLAFIPLVAVVIMLAYGWYIQRKMRHDVEESSRYASQKNAHLIESLGGIETLKLHSAESQYQQRWEELVGNIANWNMRLRSYGTRVSSLSGLLQQLSTVAIVVAGVYLIIDGGLSMGGMIAAVMLTGRALVPFNQISLLSTRYNQAVSALKHLDEIMKLPAENTERYLQRSHIDGRIEFDQVGFSYPQSQKAVFNSLSFTLKPKEKVAIIGRIGAGKTTIEKLLLGLYTPGQGSIRLDGVDINQVSPADLRQKMGCVPQDINLFYGSIRDNITLGVPHVEDERILRAARLAGVSQFTDVDPEGMDKQVGERGIYLSGGQRQAIALARALLFNPPILVLDEPTSHMDNFTEQQVKTQIASVAADKSLLLVTHKMSMLDLVDRVIVLEGGRIVADGPKAKVLEALKDGRVRMSEAGQ
ncbi:MAG: type I secretion system permease/ATPase [Motiliproteus sp.]